MINKKPDTGNSRVTEAQYYGIFGYPPCRGM